jgi:hypothetical protein
MAGPSEAAAETLRWADHLALMTDVENGPFGRPIRHAALESIKVAVSVLLDGTPNVPVDCLTELRTLLSEHDSKRLASDEADMRRTVEFVERQLMMHTHRGFPLGNVAREHGPSLLGNLQESMPERFGGLTEGDCFDALYRWTGGKPRKGELTTIGVAVNLSLRCGAFGKRMRETATGYSAEREKLYHRIAKALKR